jgi:RNA-directed DNA polymerase
MEHIMNNPSYKCYSIPKKKGGTREIVAPGASLKKIQKQLNYFLQAYYLCIKPEEVHGFVINPHYLGEHCNIVANASPHVGKKYLLNMDLKDFFPGITAKRVKGLFQSSLFGYNDQISTSLTLLTTYHGKLPIGAPTSPVISNFICYQLDGDLITFSESHNLVYSRYADDLTFSSDEPIPPSTFEEITELIENNQFVINNKKTRLTTMNRRQVVTGITVNEKVNVNRTLLKRIRAMTHDLAVNGKEAATRKHFNIQGDISSELQEQFMNRLGGYINFIGQVKGKSDDTFSRLKLSY